MRDLEDTQPSQSFHPPSNEPGLSAPPRLLFWGTILFFALVLAGIAAVIFGFREVLQPAQQQRIIDQLPFMSVLRKPTPAGGVFPTLIAPDDSDSALSLLDIAIPATPAPATAPPTAIQSSATPSPTATPAPEIASPPQSPTAGSANPSAEDPASAPEALPGAARISGVRHQQQTWNNCGPATITMALSYYGWQQDQAYAGRRLKPNREDKNVSPDELAAFVAEETFVKALVRMGGTLDLLKRLVANGFPVVIETGAMFEAYDWIGHYRVLIAYDDSFQQFYFFDSFLGVGDGAQGVSIGYAQVDKDWQAFNRTFIVVYEPQREALLQSLMGDHWVESAAAHIAFESAQSEARQAPQNAFAWLNMGTSLVALDRHAEAAVAFDQANRTGKLPWRIFWYQFGIFEAYFEVGRYDDVLSLARINQNNSRELEETYYWQGMVRQAQGKLGSAESLYRRALAYNPSFAAARDALESLN